LNTTDDLSEVFYSLFGLPSIFFGYELGKIPFNKDSHYYYIGMYTLSDFDLFIPHSLFFEAQIEMGGNLFSTYAKTGLGWSFLGTEQNEDSPQWRFPPVFMYYMTFGITIGGSFTKDYSPIYEKKLYALY